MSGMRTIEGKLTSEGIKVAIVAGRFNGFIVEQLIAGALDALRRTGCADENITLIRCPGAFEIPQVARWAVQSGAGYDVVLCLGCVIRGATPHFDYVAAEAAKVSAIAA